MSTTATTEQTSAVTLSTTFRDSASLSIELICSNLSHRSFRVFALLSTMGNEAGGPICVRHATLAEKLHVSVGTIGRALKELLAKGLLSFAAERRPGHHNVYDRDGRYDRAVGPAVAQTGSTAASPFPPELVAYIKEARSAFQNTTERVQAVVNAIAQFLPASIIDHDHDNMDSFRFVAPKTPMPPLPSMPPMPPTRAMQLTRAMQPQPNPLAEPATQAKPTASVTVNTTAAAATTVAAVPSPSPAELRARIELLKHKYDECLETEASGFMLKAFELRKQMNALENRLSMA